MPTSGILRDCVFSFFLFFVVGTKCHDTHTTCHCFCSQLMICSFFVWFHIINVIIWDLGQNKQFEEISLGTRNLFLNIKLNY